MNDSVFLKALEMIHEHLSSDYYDKSTVLVIGLDIEARMQLEMDQLYDMTNINANTDVLNFIDELRNSMTLNGVYVFPDGRAPLGTMKFQKFARLMK